MTGCFYHVLSRPPDTGLGAICTTSLIGSVVLVQASVFGSKRD